MKLLVAADCKVSRRFIDILENELNFKVELFYIDSTGKKRRWFFLRHMSYFLVALMTFIKRRKYQGILFWQQFIGFYYGFLTRLNAGKKDYPVSVVLPLIYRKRKGMAGKFYKLCFQWFLDSQALNFFVCLSRREYHYYVQEFGAKYQNKILFVKYGIEAEGGSRPEIFDEQNRYFFSGGTSNRDYKTLVKAFEGLKERLKIACFPNDLKGIKIPSNVEVNYNLFGKDFLTCMKNAYAVIIPLEDTNISSGQLVLLQAMSLGKAIILTKSGGVEDYVDNDCVMLVNPHCADEIKKAILDLVNNKEKKIQLELNAYQKFKNDFTIEKFGKRIADIFKKQEKL